ncbi:MAG: lipoprotein N-acyltransferase Lnb domain-containing protein [Bdellovibrio sp.]
MKSSEVQHLALWIVSIFLMLAGSFAQAKDIWLGYVGPNLGLGFLGHGLLVVTEKGQDPLLGISYSFAYALEEHQNISSIIDWSSVMEGKVVVKGKLEKYPFTVYYHYYATNDDRPIYLQKLNLTDDEQTQLIHNLEDIMQNPSVIQEYSIVNRNCLSFMIEQLNNVVTEDRKVALQKLDAITLPSLSILKNPKETLLARVPMLGPYSFKGHPLFTESVILYRPFYQKQKNIFEQSVRPLTTQLMNCLGVDHQVETLTINIVALSIKTENERLLSPLTNLVRTQGKCIPIAEKLYGFIFNSISPMKKESRSRFYRESSMLRSSAETQYELTH